MKKLQTINREQANSYNTNNKDQSLLYTSDKLLIFASERLTRSERYFVKKYNVKKNIVLHDEASCWELAVAYEAIQEFPYANCVKKAIKYCIRKAL